MGEHDPCSAFLLDFLSGSEDEVTSPPPTKTPFPLAKMGCENERRFDVRASIRKGSRGLKRRAHAIAGPRTLQQKSSSAFLPNSNRE